MLFWQYFLLCFCCVCFYHKLSSICLLFFAVESIDAYLVEYFVPSITTSEQFIEFQFVPYSSRPALPLLKKERKSWPTCFMGSHQTVTFAGLCLQAMLH